ncbi:GHMP kinase [Streptomyces amakusaensis]|uniref:GHMP kinase n=1 Tax=Streptomyces amakusaensis TaxID=67271 RepID=A0ABW0AK87_9ACTN
MTDIRWTLPEPLAPAPAEPTGRQLPAVVTARSPLRVSLAGGGTDLPSYSSRYGGLVISCAINRYVGVTVFPREFRGRARVVVEGYSEHDHTDQHPNPMTRACLLRAGLHSGYQLTAFSDVPSGCGLGGSGAFAVSVLHAGSGGARPPARTLAESAAEVEISDLGRPVGKQDHYMAAYGGIRLLRFHPSGSVDPDPLVLAPAFRAELESQLLLFHTGTSRDAGSILADQNKRTLQGHSDALRRLHAIRSLADEMTGALESRDMGAVAGLINEHWSLKARLSARVSSPRLQALHDTALEAGAAGAKLLGSGGGGFLLLVCPRNRQSEVRRAMDEQGLPELSFRFTDSGSRSGRLPL